MDMVNEWENRNRNGILRNKTIFLRCLFSNPRVLLLMLSTYLFKTFLSCGGPWSTRDIKWGEHGYSISEAIEKHTCRALKGEGSSTR